MSESDDSDNWAMEELCVPVEKTSSQSHVLNSNAAADQNDDADEGWESKLQSTQNERDVQQADEAAATNESISLIIVDMTVLSGDVIHSKFDANAVNDPAAVKQLRLKLETEYDAYAKNTAYLANGTVVQCGSSVWRPALSRLRQEHPGHYFCAIFPPTAKK